ncbi:MAG: riboflavin synthase [Desulfuromonadaceae bacterium]|nr:riboflavin synthase [Desulfuromonadaceae bacterium]MDD2856747.1 riboflavin synthase [Desulfuromonadaceae bacterium]
MFTGLIEDTGRVVSFRIAGEAGILEIETALPTDDIAIGDSIAVNGACLTVTFKKRQTLVFDVSPESISRTLTGGLVSGCRINLERALRIGDRIGGHIVTGHIDCTAKLSRHENRSGNYQLYFTLPEANARYIVEKGSVTIDGISLTVNSVSNTGFSVNIIPHTYTSTTLSGLHIGDQVNIETDIIGKYVERLTAPWKPAGTLTIKTLAENGFI